MAVYTELTSQDITTYLSLFDLGELQSFSPISAGIENSNYRIETSLGRYVLTLFEHHAAAEVEDFIRLARHLGEKGQNTPAPIEDNTGHWLHQLKNKPAILCHLFPGQHPDAIGAVHCTQVGSALGEFHLASSSLVNCRPDIRGYDWWLEEGGALVAELSPGDIGLLEDELGYQTEHRQEWLELPHGWIHGDLFHDNAMFEGDRLTAIIDLYNACEGAWLYDLAVVANDWCRGPEGELVEARVKALLNSYDTVRPLTENEYKAWPLVLRGAALRFWLSRLLTQRILVKEGKTLPANKQPSQFRDILELRRSGL